MQWVKSNVRRPEVDDLYYTMDSNGLIFLTRFFDNQWHSTTVDPIDTWLDESEPSFTLQNMLAAYKEGELEASHDFTGRGNARLGRELWFLEEFGINIPF